VPHGTGAVGGAEARQGAGATGGAGIAIRLGCGAGVGIEAAGLALGRVRAPLRAVIAIGAAKALCGRDKAQDVAGVRAAGTRENFVLAGARGAVVAVGALKIGAGAARGAIRPLRAVVALPPRVLCELIVEGPRGAGKLGGKASAARAVVPEGTAVGRSGVGEAARAPKSCRARGARARLACAARLVAISPRWARRLMRRWVTIIPNGTQARGGLRCGGSRRAHVASGAL
jgi:hypothetical protein